MSANTKNQKPARQEKPAPPPKEPKVVIENSAGTYSGKTMEEAIAKAVGERK
jgi:hypothetical protein